ncbi:hypothetical protein [Nocardiopsis halophila]|uniref:hypothetical protein n=1 Tax=Nocardiopsis halophila TaxID=141692 RepID=UPI0003774E3D|nr:hypothetical protein [Nocardiopsis halophila]
MSFEPTQVQPGVDPNMYTLIDPDAIPYPLTDVESLASAAETLRTKGQDLLDGAEDLRSTWKGLDAHYEAPESEKLFSKMEPVATRGEDLQSDLSTVADALEELAEAAKTARRSLNNLRIDAQGLWNRNHDKPIWWLTKDEQTDEWALLENIRIKDAVNSAWSTFNQAENDCANKISALFGGPTYVSSGEGGGKDVRVYGLAPDAGERDLSLDQALSFEGLNSRFNDFAGWAGNKIDPSNVEWGNDAGQAVWDVVVTDTLWGAGVGLYSKLGFWNPKSGWRFDLSGRWENFKAAWKGAALDTAALVGVHDEHGWLWDPGEGGREGWGAGWDRWLGNVEASKDELVEGYTAWSTREDGTSYSNTTMVANAAMFTGGLPLKAAKIVLGTGVDAPNGKHSSDSPDSEEEGGSGKSTAHGGPGTNGWPSSPLPQRPGGGALTTERFEHSLKTVRESLLDPNRLRPAPSGRPDRPNPAPTPDSGSDGPSQQLGTPQRGGTPNDQEGRTPPARPGDKGAQERPEKEDKEDAGLPGRAGEKPGAPAPPGRPASESPRVRENGQDDGPVQHRDDDQEEAGKPGEEPKRPDTAAAGGAGGGADDPPKDRTTTGGGDDEGADDPSGEGGASGSQQNPGAPEQPSPGAPGGGGADGKGDGSLLTPDPSRPEYLPPDDSRMDPALAPEVLNAVKNTPGVRQLSFNDAEYQQIIKNLSNKPYGQQTAEMILETPVTKMKGFSGIVAALKDQREIESKNQEIRLALDIHRSGVPVEDIEFRGKDKSTGEDLDVAVVDDTGNTVRGYQAYLPSPDSLDPMKSARKKLAKQLPFEADTENQVGVVEMRMDSGDVPYGDIEAMEAWAKKRNLSLHLHFKDDTITLPRGTQIYKEGN